MNNTDQIPMCCNCKHGRAIPTTNTVLCPLKGVVTNDYFCSKYKFNLLNLKPRRKLISFDYSEEDFSIISDN